MKKYLIKVLIIFSILPIISGCFTLTRTETDVYTITDKDSTIIYHASNHPGNRDNGVISPSSKVVISSREINQRDSIVDRFYPDFIRFGFFESIGIIGGKSENAIGTGLFGIYPDFFKISEEYRGEDGAIFSGGIYRIGIIEKRLRWFRDSKNWTIGTSLVEFIIPDSRGENMLVSFLPIYLRKRYYLREEIPYIALTPSVGFGYFPSFYTNLSGSIEVGSIGGLNLRAYIGLAAGYNPASSPQVKNNEYVKTDEGVSTIFPYFGLGISVLDFHNLVRETEAEWKYYEHSSWDVGLAQFTLLNSNAEESIFDGNQLYTGFQFKLANAYLAIPHKNNKFTLGTSLLNIMVLGKESWGIGVLPIKAGYWFVVADDELSFEPFIEYNYYPSSMFNLGGRLNLVLSESINLGLSAGYVSGSNSANLPKEFNNNYGITKNFSNLYFGISVGLLDRIFYPHQLRYYK